MPALPSQSLLTALSHLTRWQILDELLQGEALPIYELAKRLKIHRSTLSKHVAILARQGLLVSGYGNVYRIAPRFLVEGERALDLGPILLRIGG